MPQVICLLFSKITTQHCTKLRYSAKASLFLIWKFWTDYSLNLRKFVRMIWNCERTFLTHDMTDFLNGLSWMSCSSPVVMYIYAPIHVFPAPFLHSIVTHSVIIVNTTQSMMNLGYAVSCLLKTNHTGNMVHIYSVTARAQHNN